MGENIKWLVILRKRGHIGEDDDGLQNSLVPFPWAILSFYEDRFEECFEKCCSACEFFFEDFSSDLWHFPSCISASSSKAEHHDLWVIRSHWSARDESGEPPDRELSSAVGHVAVMVWHYMRRALGLLEIALQGLTNRRQSLWVGAASVLGGASIQAACWLWKVVCRDIAECKEAGETLGCSSALRSSLQAVCLCLGLLCFVDFACCKPGQGSREAAYWCWAVLCLCGTACKGAANGILDIRIGRVLRVVTGAAIGLLNSEGMVLFGCLCLARLIVDSSVYMVSWCFCLGLVMLCARYRVKLAARSTLGAEGWLLLTVWDWLMIACGWERAFFFEHTSASELREQWKAQRKGWMWALKNNLTVRAAAEAVKRALSDKWAACHVIHTVIRQARLGRGRSRDVAVRIVDAKSIVMHAGRPARVRWVFGGKVVMRAEAMEHRAKGDAVFCVPELHGGGGCISAEKYRYSNVRAQALLPEACAAARCCTKEDKIEGMEAFCAPELPSVGIDSAEEGHGVYFGVEEHATPSHKNSVFQRTPEQAKEYQAGFTRLGINDSEVMKALRRDLWGSVHPDAPMRVVRFSSLEAFGELPRSSDNQTVLLSEKPDAKIVFISHRWLRPWHTREECEKNGHAWAGMAHPDDAKGTKHKLICAAVKKLCLEKEWDLENVCIWLDYCGVVQDNKELLGKGVASLRGYVTVCDAIIIPSPSAPEAGAETIDLVPGQYGDRGWTRLEAMSFYCISTLRQVETPEIWVAAGGGACFLKRFSYVLTELPSKGELFSENDRKYIQAHEQAFLKELRASVVRNGYITKHKGAVKCVAFHPTEEGLVASCGEHGKIKLVDRDTGTLRRECPGHEGGVLSIAFNCDGSKLVSGGTDGTVRIWDVAAGKEVTCLLSGRSGRVTSVAFSPNGKIVASGSDDQHVILWDVPSGAQMCSLTGHSDVVSSVVFSPNGNTIASGSDDLTVRLWDVASGLEKCSLTGHSEPIYSVAFSPNGSTLASGSQDMTVRLWDVVSKAQKCSLTGHSGPVYSLVFSLDGSTLASGSEDLTVRLWDVASGAERRSLTGHSGRVRSVAFSPDGNTLASGSDDLTVRLWDIASKADKCSLMGHSRGVTSVAFSPDGKTLASGSWDETVRLWDVASGAEKCSLMGHSDSVTSVAFSPDGSTLASGSDDKTVRLWDVASGAENCSLRGHSDLVSSVAFSLDGNTLASGSQDMTVRLWDVASGTQKCSLRGHLDKVRSVAFSSDGNTLVSGSDDQTVRLWDVASGTEKCSLKGRSTSWVDVGLEIRALGETVEQMAWTVHTGKYVVTAEGDTVHLYKVSPNRLIDVQNSKIPVASFRSPSSVSAVVCRPPIVCAACSGGQVLFLEAPLLLVRSGD